MRRVVTKEPLSPPPSPIQEQLSAQIRSAPPLPGVYLFRNSAGQILYIGKALSLRKRLRSYLAPSAAKDPHLRVWLEQATQVEWHVTYSELEALILEARWIKQLYPWFNRALRYYRHHNAHLFLKVNLKVPFPVFAFVEEVEEDGSLYYGPLLSPSRLRQTLKSLSDALGLCTCGTPELYSEEKPCFRSQIGRCLLPCKNKEEQQAYRKAVTMVCDWLEGQSSLLAKTLLQKREQASANLQFEQASRYQKTLEQVQLLQKRSHSLRIALDHLSGLIFQPAPPVILLLKWGRLLGQWPIELPLADKAKLAERILEAWASHTEKAFRRISPAILEEIQITETWLTHRAKDYPCLMTTHLNLQRIQQWLKTL